MTKDNVMKTRTRQKRRRQSGIIHRGGCGGSPHPAPHALRNAIASRLSRNVPGRIVLHLTCLLRDAKSAWHWTAIRRQLGCCGCHE
jgi:hypothetical protein